MGAEWERLYREAFQEFDAEKVPELCDCARRAIHDRLIELSAQTTAAGKEREQLFEALRQLLIHEYKRRAPNGHSSLGEKVPSGDAQFRRKITVH
ncbi:MAG: hypothetical protein WA172_03095 [Terriglobales bacterium]